MSPEIILLAIGCYLFCGIEEKAYKIKTGDWRSGGIKNSFDDKLSNNQFVPRVLKVKEMQYIIRSMDLKGVSNMEKRYTIYKQITFEGGEISFIKEKNAYEKWIEDEPDSDELVSFAFEDEKKLEVWIGLKFNNKEYHFSDFTDLRKFINTNKIPPFDLKPILMQKSENLIELISQILRLDTIVNPKKKYIQFYDTKPEDYGVTLNDLNFKVNEQSINFYSIDENIPTRYGSPSLAELWNIDFNFDTFEIKKTLIKQVEYVSKEK